MAALALDLARDVLALILALEQSRAGRTITGMSPEPPVRSPLQERREPDWATINADEAEQDAAFATALTISERLELGQELCDQAFELLNAFRVAGHGTVRDPRA